MRNDWADTERTVLDAARAVNRTLFQSGLNRDQMEKASLIAAHLRSATRGDGEPMRAAQSETAKAAPEQSSGVRAIEAARKIMAFRAALGLSGSELSAADQIAHELELMELRAQLDPPASGSAKADSG